MKAYIIGTCDTKYEELNFVKIFIEKSGIPSILVDVSTKSHANAVDVTNRLVSSFHPSEKNFVDIDDRGKAILLMSEALEKFLLSNKEDVAGAIGLGGSGGTSLISKGLRALPIGVPKIMVSTVASGNTAPYVGPNDIYMLYSVTDIAGINSISSVILTNAANALIGMIKSPQVNFKSDKPAIGLTMFGVTTPCVSMVREQLEKHYDCLVFHATGIGGQSMEKLVDSRFFSGVIDITTTEVCDLFMGGVMSAGEDRFESIVRTKIPYVGSVGALDMVNFGPIETLPRKYKKRNLYIHNPQVTLMRTTPKENALMGKWIAEKMNKCEGSVRFLLPLQGVSAIDISGKPFYDPEADLALFESIEKYFIQTDNRRLIKINAHINDKIFADAIVHNFKEII